MNNEIFIPIKFVSSINLRPFEVNDKVEDVFLKKIKEKYEGLCTKHGYIKKNSIKIIKRSIGSIVQEHFNSTINFNFQCVAEIFNPIKGSIIKAIVQNKNEMGILAKSFYNNEAILEVIIPKISAGIKSDIDLTKLNIGDEVYVEIYGKKFILYDKFISIIGKAIDKNYLNVRNDANVIDNDDDDDDVFVDDDEIISELHANVEHENKDNNDDDEDDDDEDEDDDDDEDDEDDEDDDIINDDIIDDDYEDIEETLFDD